MMGKVDPERLMAVLDAITDDPAGRATALGDAVLMMADLADRIAAGERALAGDFHEHRIDEMTYRRMLVVYRGLVDVRTRLDMLLFDLPPTERDRVRVRVVKGLPDESTDGAGAEMASRTAGDEPGRTGKADRP